MNLSIFDIVGPVMIGPSSSHTAGAARLALVAARLAPKGWQHVTFALAGSFAKTGKGHGTDKALLAGALGLRADDERLRDAFALASERGTAYTFTEIDLPDCHENTVVFTFDYADGTDFRLTGSSIGGGRICVTDLNGMPVEFYAECPTLIVRQNDRKGVISAVSHLLAANGINIGVMRVSRIAKGDIASCIIETDAPISKVVGDALRHLENILDVCVMNT